MDDLEFVEAERDQLADQNERLRDWLRRWQAKAARMPDGRFRSLLKVELEKALAGEAPS